MGSKNEVAAAAAWSQAPIWIHLKLDGSGKTWSVIIVESGVEPSFFFFLSSQQCWKISTKFFFNYRVIINLKLEIWSIIEWGNIFLENFKFAKSVHLNKFLSQWLIISSSFRHRQYLVETQNLTEAYFEQFTQQT